MFHNLKPIEGYGGIQYNINWCHAGMRKFEEGTPEHLYFFKIFVQLARKLSNLAYEGEVFTV